MIRTPLALAFLSATLGLASAADPPATTLPSSLPEKDGEKLTLGRGEAATREDALKAAYKDAIRQEVKVLVLNAEELLADDKTRAKLIEAAAGVITRARELSAEQGSDGLWRVEIQAKVSPLKVAEALRKAEVPLKPAPAVKVDGETEFAKAATRLKAAEEAAAWFDYVLRGYPFGCHKVELVGGGGEDEDASTKAVAVWKVRVRHTIDMAAYKKMAGWLAESLEHLSTKPSAAFTYDVETGSVGDPVVAVWVEGGKSPSNLEMRYPERSKNSSYFVLLATDTTGKPFTVGTGQQKRDFMRYTVSGRTYVLDRAVERSFAAATKTPIYTHVMLKNKAGKTIAETKVEWSMWDQQHTPMPFLELDHKAAFMRPSATGGDRYGSHGPYVDRILTISLPRDDLRQVTSAEVELVVGPRPAK